MPVGRPCQPACAGLMACQEVPMTDEELKQHHGEKELAAFIRPAAKRRPDQAYGDYYRGKSASCALGAAYEGMYRLPEQ